MSKSLTMMTPTMIAAAMGLACLSDDGLAWLVEAGPFEVHTVRTLPLEMRPDRPLLLALTAAFAEIGIVRIVHDKDGPGVAWRSQADQQRWFRQLDKLPQSHRTR